MSSSSTTNASAIPPLPPAVAALKKKAKAPRLTRQLTSTMDAFDDADQTAIAGMKTDGATEETVRKELAAKRDQRIAVGVPSRMEFFFSTATDIGGGHTNQDDAATWVYRRDENTGQPLDFVLAVFDGHGRELGQLASEVAKNAMEKMFLNSEVWLALRSEASRAGMMRDIFLDAHAAIKSTFRKKYEDAGWQVEERPGGLPG